jgi:hypothetical protein
MSRLTDVICSIGGTDMTRRMREPMGFRARNAVQSCVRTIRPVRSVMREPLSWKTPVRILNRSLRSWRLPRRSKEWDAAKVTPADFSAMGIPYARPTAGQFVFEQSGERLAFVARCPAARFDFYAVRRNDRVAGYFAIRRDDGVARIVDAWVDEPGWTELYSLAVRKVLEDTRATAVITYAPVAEVQNALARLRFQAGYEEPVYVYDPGGLVPADTAIFLQLIHTDYAFL